MKFGSLKARLIALNAGIVGLMSMGSAYLLYTAANDEEKLLLEALDSRSQVLSNGIQDQFYERYGDVKAFATALGRDVGASKERRSSLLNAYVSLYGIYDLIVMVDTEGKFLASSDRDPAGTRLDVRDLEGMSFVATPWFTAVRSGKYTEDANKGFTEVFMEQPNFDPMVEAVLRKPAFGNSFSAPVRTESGQLLGYVTTRAGFRWVEDVLKRAYLEDKAIGKITSGYLLYGADGKVYSHYNPEQNNHDTAFSRDKAFLGSLSLEKLAEFGQSGLEPGKAGLGSYAEAATGHTRTISFRPVSGPKIIDGLWNIAAHLDEDEAFAARDALIEMFVVLLLLASASALITGLLSGNRLSAKLQTLVGQLHAQGVDVLEASGQVSETSERLSSASAQQAAALQQTVAAVNEISAMVGRTADMATQSRNSSQSSRNVASDGKRTVDDMIDSMMQIKESNGSILMQVEEGNKEISQIVKVISEIGNKTKVINDIVFQTKLLSFNASVEAARAGEHGKGFAVVAEEVGNLAQMSGQAAKEISDLLEQSVVQVQTIVDQTGSRVEKLIVDARERVAVGEDTAKRCAAMLEQILLNADEVNSLVNEIATSAQEQARGVQEINSAMTELDHVTQQNSAAAAQASSLSGSLMVQSQSLSTLVGTLNALVSGDTGGVSPTSGVPGSSSGATPSTSLRSLGDQHSSRPAVPRTMDASTGAGFVDEAKGGNVRSLASGLRNSRGASGRRQSPHDSSMFGEGGTAMRDSGVPRSNDPRFED